MNLTWHIAKKDLRRLRWPLGLFGALVVLQYVLWLMSRAQGEQYLPAATAVWGMHLLMAWLLVPQFVQEDSVVGLAGWRVQPISGARLFAAKTLGIFLGLSLWPSVLTLPWWLEFGFGLGEIVHVMAVNTLGMMVLTGVAMLVAVLTENFAKFIAASLVTVVAGGLIALMLAAAIPANGDGAIPPSLTMTRAALAWGLVLVAVVVIVPLQFVARRPGFVRALAIGAGIVAAVVAVVWPVTLAQMQAWTGLERFALPKVTASLGETQLVMPADPTQQPAAVRVTTKFIQQGLQAGDSIAWAKAEPTWTIGAERRPPLLLNVENNSPWARDMKLSEWIKGRDARHDNMSYGMWLIRFPGEAGPLLKNGEALLAVQNQGVLWRMQQGATAPLVPGAGAVRGLGQMHVLEVQESSGDGLFPGMPRARWLEIEPLFAAASWLHLVNPDGMERHRWKPAFLSNAGGREIIDFHPSPVNDARRAMMGRNKLLIGLVGMTQLESSFDWRWWVEDPLNDRGPVPFAGAHLTTLVMEEVGPVNIAVKEAQVIPSLVIEGNMREALRRAQAEDRPALVRVGGDQRAEELLRRWPGASAQELLTQRFIVGQATAEEAVALKKPTDDENAATLIIFNARGEERDRLRNLVGVDLETALRANLEGKTYASVVLEKLNATGGQDRKLRFQLHEALRARGELTGSFNAILWLMENPQNEFYNTEISSIGRRLERMVAVDGSARADFLKHRERAIEALQRNPGDPIAGRLLYLITLGLQHDDAVWMELPRLLPKENPLWWQASRSWLGKMAQEKRYNEAVAAMDLEGFFSAGPEWVRANLAKRAMLPNGKTAAVVDWQRQLIFGGQLVVEVLAGAQQEEAALRVARAIRRLNRTTDVRDQVVLAMKRGNEALADRFYREETNGR